MITIQYKKEYFFVTLLFLFLLYKGGLLQSGIFDSYVNDGTYCLSLARASKCMLFMSTWHARKLCHF